MGKGIVLTWGPGLDAEFQKLIDSANGFAERYMITSLRNILKYDGRTREAHKARARLHLMLAMATDQDLAELEALALERLGEEGYQKMREVAPSWRAAQEKIRTNGIPRDLLEG